MNEGLIGSTAWSSKLDSRFSSRGLTRRAVIDFQRASDLDPDGIIGRQTWHALEAA